MIVIKICYFLFFQNLKDQILTTNVWLEHVSNSTLWKPLSINHAHDWFCRNGKIINSRGIPRNMVEWRKSTSLPNTFGFQTLFCTTSEYTSLKTPQNGARVWHFYWTTKMGTGRAQKKTFLDKSPHFGTFEINYSSWDPRQIAPN